MFNEIIRNDLEEIYNEQKSWSCFEHSTVMITGAYGMIASYITNFFMFLHEEKEVDVNLVLLGRSEEKMMHLVGNCKDYINIIISDLSSPVEYDGEVNYIIHAASLASPQYYATVPVDVLKPNVIGTYYLLEFAKNKNVDSFLLFSTGDIYGKVSDIKCVGEDDYGIMDTLDIHNCYSESKRMAETMCMSFLIQYKTPIKIARIWHTYAPTMNIKNDPRVFASFVNDIVENRDIVMKSDGTGKRAFCYITDAVYGFLKVLLCGEVGEAYNVCNESQFISIAELADEVCGLRPEKGLKVIHKKRSKNESYKENIHLLGVQSYPSSNKLRQLGWEPKIDVKEGFNRVLKYYGY